MKSIKMNLGEHSYEIILERGCVHCLHQWLDTEKKTFLVSDSGVPNQLIDRVKRQFKDVIVFIIKQGEESKSFEVYESALRKMLQCGFTRKDQVVALGGGVVGDLSGFVAASYMRGIDFIQIPTTTLSQIDSSIGGKVAINVDGAKNCVGAFWQPKKVLIDPDTLSTLSQRHFNNGLVEALKAGCLADERLIQLFENGKIEENLEEILYRSLMVKKNIVEQDEKETGLRKILNFGHTLGHGIESYYQLCEVYHGEAVALGMMMVIENEVIRNRLKKIYQKLNLKSEIEFDVEEVYEYMKKDKKGNKDTVSMILLPQFQQPIIVEKTWEEAKAMLRRAQK